MQSRLLRRRRPASTGVEQQQQTAAAAAAGNECSRRSSYSVSTMTEDGRTFWGSSPSLTRPRLTQSATLVSLTRELPMMEPAQPAPVTSQGQSHEVNCSSSSWLILVPSCLVRA